MTEVQASQAFAAFDPFDPGQASHHHEVMAEMRATCPVARLASGMAVVSRYDDVRSALNQPALRNRDAARVPGVVVPEEDRLFFFEYDPPEHSLLRRLLVDMLSRSRAEQLAPAVRGVAGEILAPIAARGRADLVAELSVPLAGRMMMRVAGFPEDDAPVWRSWIKDMVVTGFSFTNRNDRGTGMAQCYPDVLRYLDRHLAGEPGPTGREDVLARVLEARSRGTGLSRTQERMILFSVVSAGTNTLVNFMGNTLLSLARDRRLFETLAVDRHLLPAAVEESLRRDSPSMYITRRCAEATQVAGTPIEPGDKLLLGLASANRDQTAFPQPEEFRLDRRAQPSHLAFGWGSHLCLGAWVARQIGVTMLDTFLDHFAGMELETGAAVVPYLSPQGYGLDALHVRLEARATPTADRSPDL